jgi:hypothetical protein
MAVHAKFNLPYPNRAQRSRLIRERSVASWSQNTNVRLAPEAANHKRPRLRWADFSSGRLISTGERPGDGP